MAQMKSSASGVPSGVSDMQVHFIYNSTTFRDVCKVLIKHKGVVCLWTPGNQCYKVFLRYFTSHMQLFPRLRKVQHFWPPCILGEGCSIGIYQALNDFVCKYKNSARL